MKTVILDAFAVNPGDLSWDWLKEYGEVSVNERTLQGETLEKCLDADVVFTNKTPLRQELIEKLPKLKYIGVLATGYNVVDVDYCHKRGIIVTNIPAYSTDAVAQLTFSLMTAHTNHVYEHAAAVREGQWAKCPDFTFHITPLSELAGKTMGIIGFGRIGKQVARIANAYNMKVLVKTNHPGVETDVEFVQTDELLDRSDFVSLHCPLTPNTQNLVNEEFLSKMKKSAMLINTSRGAVIDEKALYEALLNKKIAAAGLDVLCSEPPESDNPLFTLENCYITPHIAWAGFETRERLMEICKENMRAFVNGRALNRV